MQEKIIIILKPKIDKPELVTKIRKNECTIEIDPEMGLIEYDVKLDYDQDVKLEDDGGLVNLAYKKYEKGIVHMKDVVGIWSSTTPIYEAGENDTVIETYNHTIEIATIGEPLFFTIEHKDLKPNYEILRKTFIKFKTQK